MVPSFSSVRKQAVLSVARSACTEDLHEERGGRKQQNSRLGAAQYAASNRPLPGAETALFLYHRYFSGAQISLT